LFLSRFLFQSSDAAKSKQEIKPKAVRPIFIQENSRYELSVFNTEGCTQEQAVEIAKNVVGVNRAEPLKYIVGFPPQLAVESNLTIENDKVGHDLHGNVLGWPSKDEERLEKSIELARAINTSSQKKFWVNPEV
jgi:hypothetical protein